MITKRLFLFLRSFRVKIALAMIILMLLSGMVGNFLVYQYAMRAKLDEAREELMMVAQAMALDVDADTILKIPLSEEGMETPQYRSVADKLSRIKEIFPDIIYIYILSRTGQEGIYEFVVDLKSGSRAGVKPPAKPGDKYDGSRFPELSKAFSAPSADKELVTDEWGVFLSGYAPIRGRDNKTAAILGIDIAAHDVHAMQGEVNRRSIFVLLLGLVLSVLFGMLVSGMATRKIRMLVEGTRHIAKGDLKYRVKVKGDDEIDELTRSFNHMAANLQGSRKKVLEYFYSVMQSLIRILEARDPYTKGHSERVSEYAVSIARKMGLPQDKIDILREGALLHDIGKLGVKEVILNKKVKLTDEERGIIMKHPVIGENILKPVAINKEVLDVVREHHERYDGKGYPDKLDGEHIDILAAIVSAADSYDAMTSDRGYEKNLTKEEGIEQLRANSGSQFNPKIVDAFIQVLQEK